MDGAPEPDRGEWKSAQELAAEAAARSKDLYLLTHKIIKKLDEIYSQFNVDDFVNGKIPAYPNAIGLSLILASENSIRSGKLLAIKSHEIYLNTIYYKKIIIRDDEDDYELKKQIVLNINEKLREFDAAVVHPDSGEPCILLAVGSPDGKGRYVFQSRLTKKRSKASRTLRAYIPFSLMPDVKRRLGFIEARKKKPKGKKPD